MTTENKKKSKNYHKDTDKRGFLANYNSLLIKYPYLMNATQTAVISSCSVIVSQTINGNATMNGYDWSEIRTVSTVAIFWITPMLLMFYSRLQKLPLGVIGKLLLDQFLFSPFFTASIVSLRTIIQGKVVYENLPTVLASVIPKAVVSSWTFWVPARGLTLYFIPPHLHMLTGSMFSFVWNILLSMMLNS